MTKQTCVTSCGSTRKMFYFMLGWGEPLASLNSMKNAIRNLLFLSAIFTAAAAYGAGLAGVDVIAKEKAGGKVVYQGKTNAAGKFTTSTLAPGSYVVEFRSKESAAFQVAMGGAKSATQAKAKAGLAYDVQIAPAAKLSGTVTALAAQAVAATKGTNPNVKIINGKRYVFVRGEIGSQMGGKWVPEEEAGVANKNETRDSRDMLRSMQDLGSQGGTGGP